MRLLKNFFNTFFDILRKKKVLGIMKIFDFWFLMDLRVLECSEHDMNIFYKISVCVYVTKTLWPH